MIFMYSIVELWFLLKLVYILLFRRTVLFYTIIAVLLLYHGIIKLYFYVILLLLRLVNSGVLVKKYDISILCNISRAI